LTQSHQFKWLAYLSRGQLLSRQGMGIKPIARTLGVSRNTVRKYLRGEAQPARYPARAPRPVKLAPFKAYLQERIEAARPHWIPAAVLLREIQAEGYTGGVSQLKCYLAPFKRPRHDPVVRFQTLPGQQVQVDFTTIRRGRNPLKAFVATLGYSRATFVRFGAREDSDAWLDGLREAFAYFGGVPEQALFDNAGAIILEPDAYGVGLHRWHPRLLALADEYGLRCALAQTRSRLRYPMKSKQMISSVMIRAMSNPIFRATCFPRLRVLNLDRLHPVHLRP
jgi:transposase